jgi:hypothetical protein
MADRLTDVNTRHWTGTDQPLAGLIRIDNVTYRYMGLDPRQVPAMQQVSLQVTPLHTIYTFEAAGVRLQVTFFTAAFPNDLDALSRPVDYLTSTDSRTHAVDLLLDVSPIVAVDSDDEDVTWGRSMGSGHAGLARRVARSAGVESRGRQPAHRLGIFLSGCSRSAGRQPGHRKQRDPEFLELRQCGRGG